jgi:putative lipoic acid-binding regulatory protein
VGVRIKAPDQEQLEGEIHQLFKHGEIKELAPEVRVHYDTLRKQLSPNNIEESPAYSFLYFLYAAFKVRPELAEDIWQIVNKYRPRREERPATSNALDATWYDLKAVLARREDGLAHEDDLRRAVEAHIDTVERTERPTLAQIERDLRQNKY